jgi:hypothetical protein
MSAAVQVVLAVWSAGMGVSVVWVGAALRQWPTARRDRAARRPPPVAAALTRLPPTAAESLTWGLHPTAELVAAPGGVHMVRQPRPQPGRCEWPPVAAVAHMVRGVWRDTWRGRRVPVTLWAVAAGLLVWWLT